MQQIRSTIAVLLLSAHTATAGELAVPPGPVAPSNPFAGAYTALGGSYGISSHRFANISSQPPGGGSVVGFFPDGAPAGWSGVAALGYNITFGPMLIGLELDGRWGDETFSQDAVLTNSSGLVSLPGGQIGYGYRFTNDAGAHLAARFGAVAGNTLVFGKLGVGASRFKDEFSVDQTGAIRCLSTAFPPPTFQQVCTAVSPIGGAGSHTAIRWLPSFTVGFGAEQNFGALFARGQVEAEIIPQNSYTFTQPTANGWSFSGSSSTSDTFWTTRASLMVGVRF